MFGVVFEEPMAGWDGPLGWSQPMVDSYDHDGVPVSREDRPAASGREAPALILIEPDSAVSCSRQMSCAG